MGYIYVIKNEVGGLGGFKIGKTIDPARRFKELQLGMKASLVGLWCSEAYSTLEKQLHITYKQFRVPQSEWFALSSNALQQVISKLNRSARQVQLEEQYRPAKPVVMTATKTTESVNLSSTYVVPVRSTYSGPNPVWTDHIGKTRELPAPLPETQKRREQQRAAYTRPAVTTSTYETTPGTTTLSPTNFFWGLALGFMPGYNIAAGITIMNKNDFKESYFFKGWVIGASALVLLLIAGYSQAKPLTNYQLEPAQNVSSLIK